MSFTNRIKLKIADVKNRSARKENVAIFHHGRCGSTVLGNLLTQHPLIYNGSEILHHFNDHDKSYNNVKKYIDLKMYFQHTPYYCFETKFMSQQHLGANYINMPLAEYIKLLKELKFEKFIVIKRVNYLRRAISVMVGNINNVWHQKDASKKMTKVNIDLENYAFGDSFLPLIKHFETMDQQYELLLQLLDTKNVLYIEYESDILANPLIAFTKACDFLKLEHANVQIDLKRTNPYSLSDLIENYTEVQLALKNTPYEWMLEEA
jgi:hypothetical protein